MNVALDLDAVERRIDELSGYRPSVTTSSVADANSWASATHASRVRFGAALERELARDVARSARATGVDPALIVAVARAESGFDPNARSATGAVGVMQLMPQTGEALGVDNPYDAAQNVRGGATYLRQLLERFGGDVPRAVAAYNAGPGAVERYGGVPPYRETRDYVARVLETYRALRSH